MLNVNELNCPKYAQHVMEIDEVPLCEYLNWADISSVDLVIPDYYAEETVKCQTEVL